MDHLLLTITQKLESELNTAIEASNEAHASATHSENIADNKYGTLALEAAYLAHGQSVRIQELQTSIALYKHFKRPDFLLDDAIAMGAVVDIEDEHGQAQRLFLGPSAGGLLIEGEAPAVRVITSATPLGVALLGKQVDDEVKISINGQDQYYAVLAIS